MFFDAIGGAVRIELGEEMDNAFSLRIFNRAGDLRNTQQGKLEVFEVERVWVCCFNEEV